MLLIQAWMESAALQYQQGVDPIIIGRTTAMLKVNFIVNTSNPQQ
jgi:hypothetical protein